LAETKEQKGKGRREEEYFNRKEVRESRPVKEEEYWS
jgi:hypothetical protein